MAKSTLGSLLIDLQLNTSTLNKQVNKVNKKLDGMASTFKKVGVALAGAFAVRGLTTMINSTLKMNDALGKTADRLGIVVEDLQGLQFGAEQSGVSVATLEMALQRMTRRISEAGQGTGEAVKALKEMGIEAENLASLSVSQQLDVLADALSGVESEADQVRLAMKLFDSEGVKLLNMLKNGSDGLRQYKDEAQSLGFVLDRSMIAKMEEANDAMNKVSKVGQGFKNVLAIAVAPAIKVVSEQFVALIANGNGANGALLTMQKIVVGMVKTYDILAETIKTSMAGWAKAWAFLNLAIASNFGTTEEVTKATQNYNDVASEAEKNVTDWAKAIAGLSDLQVNLKRAMSETPPAIDKVGDSVTKLNKVADDSKDKWKDISFVFTNAFSNMENSIVEFAKTGKASFSDFANAILEDLLRMIIRLQITIPLMRALQSSAEGGFLSGIFGGGGSVSANAKGGAYQNGVQAFAQGGIVSSPTVFPMAQGVGLMGEAGAEAIMPLSRTANGDLGIKSIGGGGGATTVNIYNQSGNETEVTESTGGGGQQQIDVLIKDSVQRGIGNGAFDTAFSSSFGISRKGF